MGSPVPPVTWPNATWSTRETGGILPVRARPIVVNGRVRSPRLHAHWHQRDTSLQTPRYVAVHAQSARCAVASAPVSHKYYFLTHVDEIQQNHPSRARFEDPIGLKNCRYYTILAQRQVGRSGTGRLAADVPRVGFEDTRSISELWTTDTSERDELAMNRLWD